MRRDAQEPDRRNEGLLSAEERQELGALVEWREQVSLVRAEAWELLGTRMNESGSRVRLFHPRQQFWAEHFRFMGHRIEGLTPTGRATVTASDLSHSRRLRIRAVESRTAVTIFQTGWSAGGPPALGLRIRVELEIHETADRLQIQSGRNPRVPPTT